MTEDPTIFRLYLPAEAGADGYPIAWHKTIKHRVRELAGHRCIRCLHPYIGGEGEWSRCDELCRHKGPMRVTILRTVEAQWRILTVHHLDEIKLNCRWWNLAALCQRCHLSVQGRVKMQRPWLFEHSDWFRPYVAGYYASTILGEELERAAVMGRMDELLALGRGIKEPAA